MRMKSYKKPSVAIIGRELQQRRRRRQKELQKSNRLDKQNRNFARAADFFVHFFAVTARLRSENL